MVRRDFGGEETAERSWTEGQSAQADASIPGHGKGKEPGGYKLFGRESSLSNDK